jgi:sigma-B regulation protein RsbU (phosphoserine phosphatase)
MKELQIVCPDGTSQVIPLEGRRITLGRSHAADLTFPNDNGLSRQHLKIENDGASWTLTDLQSKNGTTLNNVKISAPMPLKSGDRIGAGHLFLIYDATSSFNTTPVVVFDALDDAQEQTNSSTVITNLEGVIKPDSHDTQGFAAAQFYALVHAGNELSSNRPLPELFKFILDLAISAVNADRGVLLTIEESGLEVRANKGEGFHISSAVRDRVLNSGASVLVRDAKDDALFAKRDSIVQQKIRTLMAVPLQTRDQIIGIIYVDSPSLTREFTKDDLSFLTVMANIAAIRIEQTRQAALEQARQLMERDLDQAAEIQRGFLPAVAPKIRGVELDGYNAPCRTVGGDYYDFFPYGESRVALVLGDVSGKGMPASLLMMGLQARVEALIDEPKSLAAVTTRLNRLTAAKCPPNRFITFFMCILDGDTGELTYCNAGHNPPLLVRRSGAFELLKGGGPVLGILKSIEYKEFKNHVDEGDCLVIYSDGVTEAADPNSEEFETDRLGAAVAKNLNKPAATILAEVNRAVAEFTRGAPQSDDITLIVVRRVPV